MNKKFLTLIILLILFLTSTLPAQAFYFDRDNLITDFELRNRNTMTESAIQKLLEKTGSILKDYTEKVNGIIKKASKIVYEAAQTYNINPQFLLTKIDQEQALLRKKSFSSEKSKKRALDWAAGFSVCDSCQGNGRDKYKGFANQIDALASVQDDYARKASKMTFQIGKPQETYDGCLVAPKNQATANLYNYTPYCGGKAGGSKSNVGGNYLFADLWNRFFSRHKYPDSTVLKDKANQYWLIQEGLRRRYQNASIFLASHSESEAVKVEDKDLEAYEIGLPIKFADYSLVQIENKKIYLLDGTIKRKIKNMETFRKLGFNEAEIIQARQTDLSSYKTGLPIGPLAQYPQGVLAKSAHNSQIYWVQDGAKHPILDEGVWKTNFNKQKPIIVPSIDLQKFKEKDAVKIKDGSIVKSETGEYFFISNEHKLPIESAKTVLKRFGEEKLITAPIVSQASLNIHPSGAQIALVPHEEIELEQEAKKSEIAGDKIVKSTTVSKAKTGLWALWNGADITKTAITSSRVKTKITFKNKGTNYWQKGEVYLIAQFLDDNGSQVSYMPKQKFELKQNTVYPNSAQFSFYFKIPEKPGLFTVRFSLEKNKEQIKGGMYQTKLKIVSREYTAQTTENNFPTAVDNDWDNYEVELKIKNTGESAWNRRKTVLKIISKNNGSSEFYDADDWLDNKNASVSLEPMTLFIQPENEALFRFTLKTKDLSLGQHYFKIQLYEKNQGKEIMIDGGKEKLVGVRVDE